jgi:hypothetical protein
MTNTLAYFIPNKTVPSINSWYFIFQNSKCQHKQKEEEVKLNTKNHQNRSEIEHQDHLKSKF